MQKRKQPSESYPLETFIGGPLQAVAKSQLMLVDSTVAFIRTVGYEASDDGISEKPRIIPFSYNRTAYDMQNGEHLEEEVRVDVPLISLIQVPNIAIDHIEYAFSVDVKDIELNESNLINKGTEKDVPLSSQLKVMLTTPREYTRNTDKSKKIHFEIQASNGQLPEGLARVLDLMNQSITPKVIKRTPLNKENDLISEFKQKINQLDRKEALGILENLKKAITESDRKK